MRDAIDREFRFLVDESGFLRKIADDNVAYISPALVITPSYNERDGFETHIEVPVRGSRQFALGTVLGALEIDEEHAATTQASFIRTNLDKLCCLPSSVYEDLCVLMFWHSRKFRKEWGAAIIMNSHKITEEQERLDRVRTYFGTKAESEMAQ